MTESGAAKFGRKLKALRSDRNLSLRDIERSHGINTGYLSQLERGEIANPSPAVLKKLADAYSEPLAVLMRWVGYIEDDAEGLSVNQKRALSYIGDPTEDEIKALRAILDVLRNKKKIGFASARSLDLALDGADIREIRGYAVALLREIGGYNHPPTDLDDVMAMADLVDADAVTLTPEERRTLRQTFGDLADRAWQRLQGIIHIPAQEIWVAEDLPVRRRRFVQAHEVGHYILPTQRETFAYLDDQTRLRADVADLFERHANQFSIELLAQGDNMRREFDDSEPSAAGIRRLADRYNVSIQATARRVAETSKQECAVAMSFHSGRRLVSPHLYCSPRFEDRMRWSQRRRRPTQQLWKSLVAVANERQVEPLAAADAEDRPVAIEIEGLPTSRATIALLHCPPRRARLLRGLMNPEVLPLLAK